MLHNYFIGFLELGYSLCELLSVYVNMCYNMVWQVQLFSIQSGHLKSPATYMYTCMCMIIMTDNILGISLPVLDFHIIMFTG